MRDVPLLLFLCPTTFVHLLCPGHATNMISSACVINQATGCDIIEGETVAFVYGGVPVNSSLLSPSKIEIGSI